MKELRNRHMYVWKTAPILMVEGGIDQMVEKARRAHLSVVWIKIAQGTSTYTNISADPQRFADLRQAFGDAGIQVWGWHVPRCPNVEAAGREADRVSEPRSSLCIRVP